jgi:hypothetical protein
MKRPHTESRVAFAAADIYPFLCMLDTTAAAAAAVAEPQHQRE